MLRKQRSQDPYWKHVNNRLGHWNSVSINLHQYMYQIGQPNGPPFKAKYRNKIQDHTSQSKVNNNIDYSLPCPSLNNVKKILFKCYETNQLKS